IGQSFILKETSKKIFDAYWANPSSGINGEGVYTQLSYSDVDIFVTDDRWWRSADHIQDSVNGKPNPGKVMLGARQMEWLKNALAYSQATFKIIVVGSQVLNPLSPFDKLLNFPVEYYELMHFISDNKISGILFLTGDRHHSEVIKVDRPGTYPLFDITISSLTAGVAGFSQAEQHSPYNLLKIEKNNYGRFSFSGPKGQRRLLVEFIGTKGEKLGEWSVLETQLKAER
ncbi:MAG: alkaline phosphatase D family protein, partial [Flavisolibacter sp.]|nr:alkaline phosphatase D family protein [Flavisolibacter sp.]